MKKIVFSLLFTMICINAWAFTPVSTDSFVSPDDVTIQHLENFRTNVLDFLNDIDGDNIQASTITPDQLSANANPVNRWGEAFNDWIYTGFLPQTSSGTLEGTTTSGVGYVNGERVVKDTTLNTYTASKWTYVDVSDTGTYTYSETDIGGAVPAITANSIRLARVSTDATEVSSVRDDRILSISLDNNQSDYWRTGFKLDVATPDALTINPGIIYVGNIRIQKDTDTTLNLATAGDWVTGGGGRATSTMAWIVVNQTGQIKLTTTAPTKTNTGGDANGILRFAEINGEDWRYLSWFYMDSVGSGNIMPWSYSGFKDGDTYNIVAVTRDSAIETTETSLTKVDDMSFKVYSAGRPLEVTSISGLSNSSAGARTIQKIYVDSIEYPFSKAETVNDSIPSTYPSGMVTSSLVLYLEQGEHDIDLYWYVSAGTGYMFDRITTVEEK